MSSAEFNRMLADFGPGPKYNAALARQQQKEYNQMQAQFAAERDRSEELNRKMQIHSREYVRNNPAERAKAREFNKMMRDFGTTKEYGTNSHSDFDDNLREYLKDFDSKSPRQKEAARRKYEERQAVINARDASRPQSASSENAYRDLERLQREFGPNSPEEPMNGNVNDPVARGFRTIYTAQVFYDAEVFYEKVTLARNVTFGLQNNRDHITFSIGMLPPPRGTSVWLLGFANQDNNNCTVQTGVAFASKEDAVAFVWNGYEGARGKAENSILEYLENSGWNSNGPDHSLRDTATALRKGEAPFDDSNFIFQTVELP